MRTVTCQISMSLYGHVEVIASPRVTHIKYRVVGKRSAGTDA